MSGRRGRRSCLRLASACAVSPLASIAPAAPVDPPGLLEAQGSRSLRHLTVDDRVGRLLRHPAFSGHAPLLLPGDDRVPDENLPLRELGRWMPWHSHVDPPTVVGALNHMVDAVAEGQTVFHRYHDESACRADPRKARTGLFIFRGRPGAPFALIAPGGGFVYVGSLHEGFPYARQIAGQGCHAVVLRYRVGAPERVATEDMAVALSWLFRHAAALGMSTQGYSVWGSSAGARMAANIGTEGTGAFGGDDLPRPSAVVMAYTGHTRVGPQEPPTYAIVGELDPIASPEVMALRVDALRARGARACLRRVPGLGHGFGVGTGTAADGWVSEAMRFWRGGSV